MIIRRWWHKYAGRQSFRAVYPDGIGESRRETHRQANELVQIFGGYVIFDPV